MKEFDGIDFLLSQENNWWLHRSASDNPTAFVQIASDGNISQFQPDDEDQFNPWQLLALGAIGPLWEDSLESGFIKVRGIENFDISSYEITEENVSRFTGKSNAIVLAHVRAKCNDDHFIANGHEFKMFSTEQIAALADGLSDSDYRKVDFEKMLARSQ